MLVPELVIPGLITIFWSIPHQCAGDFRQNNHHYGGFHARKLEILGGRTPFLQ
jgi:hypothetical protein